MTQEVLVEHEDGMVVITINRPDQKNAVNRAVSYGVCAAIDEMDARADLHIGNFQVGAEWMMMLDESEYELKTTSVSVGWRF